MPLGNKTQNKRQGEAECSPYYPRIEETHRKQPENIIVGKDINVIADRKLWATFIKLKVEDALGLFTIPELGNSFETQYQKIRQKLFSKNTKLNKRSDLHSTVTVALQCDRARFFLERSHFDRVADDIGYGSAFVNRTFALVQEAITLEKRLWDEFKKE